MGRISVTRASSRPRCSAQPHRRSGWIRLEAVGAACDELKSMVVHDGGIGGGHNMAYVRDGNAWYWFSDEHFAVVSQGEVDRAEPYLLFYERA